MEADVITLQDLFTFEIEEVNADGIVVGQLAATGFRPLFLRKFEKRGVNLPLTLFGTPKIPSLERATS
jgi:hypothetical protein